MVKTDSREVPSVTSFLVSRLRPVCKAVSYTLPWAQTFVKNLNRLPVELVHLILNEFLHPSRHLPLECTRVIPPSFWRDALVVGRAVPWLWDIDMATCYQKDRQSPGSDSEEWDWELLVRTLSQKDVLDNIYKPENPMYGAPRGLLKRRCIWRNVERLSGYPSY